MPENMRARLEGLLGIKLTRTERDILAHVEREAEKSDYKQQIARTRVYDILESLGTKPKM